MRLWASNCGAVLQPSNGLYLLVALCKDTRLHRWLCKRECVTPKEEATLVRLRPLEATRTQTEGSQASPQGIRLRAILRIPGTLHRATLGIRCQASRQRIRRLQATRATRLQGIHQGRRPATPHQAVTPGRRAHPATIPRTQPLVLTRRP